MFPPEVAEELKKMLKEGFVYQRFRCSCGYVGNSFEKKKEVWDYITCCPKCKIELKRVPISETQWAKDIMKQLPGPIPNFSLPDEPIIVDVDV